MQSPAPYPARLDIDYQERLSRLTTFFRPIMAIPIAIVLSALSSGIMFATFLMILFRRKYPRWWFDFALEVTRFSNRVGAYFVLMTDHYPSTTDYQAVHLDLDYPDAERDLNRWMPLVKWLLLLPHYLVLLILAFFAFFAVLVAWFAILFTGRYPRALFDYVLGVMRWGLRLNAYSVLLITDRYPPFSMS
jgi:hypothetical protein